MNFRNELSIMEGKIGDICLADSATTYTILQDKKIFTGIKIS